MAWAQKDESSHKERAPLLQQVYRGPWFPRPPQTKGRYAGEQRFVMFDDKTALAIIHCAFEHASSGSVLLALLWRVQCENPTNQADPVPVSIEELMGMTGYSRRSVYRGVDELASRGMISIDHGGGRGLKSRYRLTGISEWLT
jgi:hypothetical protein